MVEGQHKIHGSEAQIPIWKTEKTTVSFIEMLDVSGPTALVKDYLEAPPVSQVFGSHTIPPLVLLKEAIKRLGSVPLLNAVAFVLKNHLILLLCAVSLHCISERAVKLTVSRQISLLRSSWSGNPDWFMV